jgi:hypothetical protein
MDNPNNVMLTVDELYKLKREAEEGSVENVVDTTILRLVAEVEESRRNAAHAYDPDLLRIRLDQQAERRERDDIARWLRVAYQFNPNALAIADAIERRDHDREYGPPAVPAGEGPAMTAAEYDAKVLSKRKTLEERTATHYGRKEIDHVFELLKIAATTGQPHDLDPEALIILNSAVYEMDRHLPDFFEE